MTLTIQATALGSSNPASNSIGLQPVETGSPAGGGGGEDRELLAMNLSRETCDDDRSDEDP